MEIIEALNAPVVVVNYREGPRYFGSAQTGAIKKNPLLSSGNIDSDVQFNMNGNDQYF